MNEVKPGTLYLVPTPIGNLADITERAVEVLKEADIIACEDTRHTRILLDHLGIAGHVVSYHEHNKKEAGPKLISCLQEGKSVAQVSDAGMPVISDPGADLVRLANEAAVPVVPLPGPNAALTALIASGLDARQFAFIGFLPKITAKRKKLLQDMGHVPVTLIFYEAPHRIKETMDTLIKFLGDRKAVTARELTKKFETFERGTLSSLRSHMDEEDPRGEYVILVEGWNEAMEEETGKETTWQEEALKLAETLPLKEAARQAAGKYNLSRREVYQFLLKK
ncbi:16S rRNA (cytidine(1402)-2'-O)-methyltransferase [uncultured Dialister sp.]|uniref:16S rRNA (cytidine(1402)-2'-O)-methyltransferase n=1 Tax=uncultured Dialister sp. TaxID=278064 RepID=UPI0026767A82|nr:16S rRNA (cytidine(1402)-2'-O)-methyltransferase [uncultured Dialister sp.]